MPGVKLAVKQTDVLLGVGAVAVLGVGYLLFRDAFAQPPGPPPAGGPDAVSITANPTSVAQGQTENITATFTRQGVPVTVPNAYMRVMSNGATIDSSTTPNVSTLNKAIVTTALAAGTYVVQVSDNANFT